MIGVGKCPCGGCVAPKRHPGCHAKCPEYLKWSYSRQQELAKIREIHRIEDDCFPNSIRHSKKRRKK